MFFLKFLRGVGKAVRGGVSPRQIALGAFLGVLIGMMPGFSLSLVIAIALLLVLSAHIGIALIGLVLGKVVCLLLAPVTFRIGHAIIHGIGLEGLFRFLSETPVLALLDLHVYCLAGGLPVAILLGAGFGVLMVRTVDRLRRGLVQVEQRSPALQKLAANPFVRVFLWLVFGPKKQTMAPPPVPRSVLKCQPVFRKAGIALVIVVLVLFVLVEFVFTDALFKAGARHGMAAANGAEVNLEGANIALNQGKFNLRGLQMTSPSAPTHNRVEAAEITADLDVLDLLRKRYVIDQVAVRNLRFDAPREAPGRVFRKPKEQPPAGAPAGEGEPLLDYLKKAERVRDYLLKAKELLDQWRAKREAQATGETKLGLLDLAANRGYLLLSAKELIANRPTWMLRELAVDGVALPGLSNTHNIRGQHLSSHPWLVAEPMSVTVMPGDGGEPTARIQFNYQNADAMHSLTANVREVALSAVVRMSEKVPLDIENATADVTLDGRFSAQKIDMPFTVEIKGFGVAEGRAILGLSPEVTRQLMRDLETLRVVGVLEGDIASPRVRVDVGQSLATMRGTLKNLGKRQLERILDEGGIEKAVPGGLLDRLRGKEGKPQEGEQGGGDEEDEQDDVRGMLEGLL